uniref:CSON003991 protein n=1 Tax=Culicoides sonorensis TaxID=179676 RepID=A0A336MRH7_CULSO
MAPSHSFWAIFYFACLCSASLANNAKVNFREKEKKILDQILGAGKYDARIRPSGINGTGKCISFPYFDFTFFQINN